MSALPSNPSAVPLLVVNKLACERGGRELFRNLQFSLPTGAVLTVGGANGAGKTSLLRILAGLALPAYGNVQFGQQTIGRNASEYRAVLSYLGHQPGTRRDETPLNHVQNRLNLGMSPAVVSVLDALKTVGLARFADRPCGELSVGQNRRTALAWLVARQSPLWILDEPLSGLDVAGQSLVAELIAAQVARGGSAILTTHQPLDLPATVPQQRITIGEPA